MNLVYFLFSIAYTNEDGADTKMVVPFAFSSFNTTDGP